MGRIRTVKPELFKHEDLYDLEKESGLPVRIAFVGLFTCCDREGRFKWRPRTLKLDVLPHDELDFSRVLDALWSRGLIAKYAINGEEYGLIPTFNKHQVINNKESASEIPAPTENSFISMTSTRDQRVTNAISTPLFLDQGDGKGKERTGMEEEWKGREGGSDAASASVPTERRATPRYKNEPNTGATWNAYCEAYRCRYNVDPVRNATVNAQMAHFVSRVGAEDAPHVARFYVMHNKSWYVQKAHAVGPMLADCEGLRTQWATGNRVTAASAQQMDRTQTNGDVFAKLIAEAEAEERLNGK
jgi:hypothetical protein